MKYLLFLSFLLIALSGQSQTLRERDQQWNETVQDSAQAIKKQVTDSLEKVTDSVSLKYTKEEILNVAKDTIKSLAETRLKAQYGHAIENPFIPSESDNSIETNRFDCKTSY